MCTPHCQPLLHRILRSLRPIRGLGLAGLLVVLLLSSCWHKPGAATGFGAHYSARQRDSISFNVKHHYNRGFNFVVKSDSMFLLVQQPEEKLSGLLTDSFAVHRHERVAVADIRTLSTDSIDSGWVELATAPGRFGWVHEKSMLRRVVPDDPISQFISVFSDTHLIIFLVVIALIGIGYSMRKLMRARAHIVIFRDIDSFYPTLLTLIVSASATFYDSIQMFAPEAWQDFYFHPTLNPFSVGPLLSVFLISVWAMLIVGLAAVDDARHQLSTADAVLYLSGLLAVCAACYIVFSITTLYYVGYILFAAFVFFALWRYFHYAHAEYICGNCGAKLRHKGRCPKCGALNE